MDKFSIIKPEQLGNNVFKLIGKDWMLLSAGNMNNCNIMTASWGNLGVLWHKNVCTCYIRPTRYTFEYFNNNDFFTLNFFDEKYKDVLNYCGSNSGRDVDKIKETGLNPFDIKNQTVGFEEAKLIIECKKLYTQDFDPAKFLDTSIEGLYPNKDYHRMYIGEIINILLKDE